MNLSITEISLHIRCLLSFEFVFLLHYTASLHAKIIEKNVIRKQAPSIGRGPASLSIANGAGREALLYSIFGIVYPKGIPSELVAVELVI